MLFFKMRERLPLVRTMFQFFLDELKTGVVLVEDFAPCLDANGEVCTPVHKPPFRVGSGLFLISEATNSSYSSEKKPEVPFDAVNAMEARIARDGERIILYLGQVLGCQLDLWRFQLDHQMLTGQPQSQASGVRHGIRDAPHCWFSLLIRWI